MSNFKLYYRAIAMKHHGTGTKTDMKNKWNKIEDPYINLHSYLIFDKGAQDSLVNKCCWESRISACRRLKLDPCLSPYTNINSKWNKGLNISPETLKLL
jgi:hypothetical protein